MTATANEIVDPISSATAVETRCAHCGLEVPPGLIELREREQFCCAGCRAVYQTLHACGLQAFYRLRDVAGRPVTPAESKFASFDTPAFHKLYVQQRDSVSPAPTWFWKASPAPRASGLSSACGMSCPASSKRA